MSADGLFRNQAMRFLINMSHVGRMPDVGQFKAGCIRVDDHR